MFDHPRLHLQVTTPEDPTPKLIPKVSIGVAVTDADRRIIQANPVFCKFLGYSAHELIGMTVDDITHPDDLDRTEQTFHRLLSHRSTDHAYEKRYLRKNGSVVWSLTTVNRLENQADPNSPLVIGFINDITRQKTTEEQLRSAMDLYQGLVENIGVGLSLIDRHHRIRMVNATLADMFGKSPKEFVGKPCHRQFENKDSICSHCPGVPAMATGRPQVAERQGVRPQGDPFKVRVRAFPVFEADGSPGGFVELVEDLSGQLETEMALEESERRFKTLADTAPIGIFEVNPEGLNTYSNQAWTHMTGLKDAATRGIGWLQAIPPEDHEKVWQSWEQSQASEVPWQKEHRLLHRNGTERWVQATATPVRNARRELLRWIGTIVDLTPHKLAMQQLAESEERFRAIYEKSGVGMNIVTPDGRFLDANPGFCALTGYSLQELKTLTVRDITFPEDRERTRKMFDRLNGPQAHSSCRTRLLHKDGKTVWGEVSAVLVPDGMNGEGFGVTVVRDITAKKEAQARLDYLDYHDELTGLPNRKLLRDRLEHAIATAQRNGSMVAVLVVGLDKFRKIFDHFDQKTSNHLLCEISRRLQTMIRQADTLARIGDTEMVVILESLANREFPGTFAQQILREIAQPILLDGQTWHLTASVGISLYPDQAESAESLLGSASGAMHRAKRLGGDTVEYVIAEMNTRARDLLALEMDLRGALGKNEFALFYQPQVELASRKVVGVEALMRWRHPQRGLVSPADFIPLAEDTGVIEAMGEWALREACRQNMEWHRAGLPLIRMAVNISPRQFRRVDISGLVGRILAETDHPAENLELEITEGMIMDDVDRAIDIMKKLATMGVHVAIDDFGTGYSSLNSLKSFPVQRLKVDRSFVKDVTTDSNDAAIATAVVALAKSMHLEVVAEGIETREQLEFFLELGCDFCQGYLFCKPLEPAAARRYLEKGGPAGEP